MCPNAPHGAWYCLVAEWGMPSTLSRARLNAPFGARCFMPGWYAARRRCCRLRLNAPFGAHLAGLPENVACNLAVSPSSFEVRTLRICGFLVRVDTCSGKLHARFWELDAF